MIKVDKYTNIDIGADPTKKYYINQNGTYISLTKVELEKIASDLKLLGIGAVSISAINKCNECSKELESGTVFCSAGCRHHYYH